MSIAMNMHILMRRYRNISKLCVYFNIYSLFRKEVQTHPISE